MLQQIANCEEERDEWFKSWESWRSWTIGDEDGDGCSNKLQIVKKNEMSGSKVGKVGEVGKLVKRIEMVIRKMGEEERDG